MKFRGPLGIWGLRLPGQPLGASGGACASPQTTHLGSVDAPPALFNEYDVGRRILPAPLKDLENKIATELSRPKTFRDKSKGKLVEDDLVQEFAGDTPREGGEDDEAKAPPPPGGPPVNVM